MVLVLTHPKKGIMPLTFELDLKKSGICQDTVFKFLNERTMLNMFFAKFKQLDPDVIIVRFTKFILIYFQSHDASSQISLLMARAEKYSIKTWSFISRLNRAQLPGRLCKTKAGQWELVAGRSVLCSK